MANLHPGESVPNSQTSTKSIGLPLSSQICDERIAIGSIPIFLILI